MPQPFMYSHVTGEDGKQHVSVFAGGKLHGPIDDSHPNYQKIMDACHAKTVDQVKVAELFDIPKTIVRKFQRLSGRVTIENGVLCFDHDPAQPGLSKQILIFLDKGDDVEPLVKFMEKIMRNPSENSRTQAWAWLDAHDFSINEDGNVIGYKGVYHAGSGKGTYCSGNAGHAFVNDVEFVNKYIPNAVGDEIRMPRSEVVDDPKSSCNAGLHIGTYEFASRYANGAMLRVIVDPTDIVSVPHDASGEKIRVCRYIVDAIITSKDDPGLIKTETMEQFAKNDPDSADVDVEIPATATIDVGATVKVPDGRTGTISSSYKGHRGKKYRVRFTASGPEAFYASELTLATDNAAFKVGDRVYDSEGDKGVIKEVLSSQRADDEGGRFVVKYDEANFGETAWDEDELTKVA